MVDALLGRQDEFTNINSVGEAMDKLLVDS